MFSRDGESRGTRILLGNFIHKNCINLKNNAIYCNTNLKIVSRKYIIFALFFLHVLRETNKIN